MFNYTADPVPTRGCHGYYCFWNPLLFKDLRNAKGKLVTEEEYNFERKVYLAFTIGSVSN